MPYVLENFRTRWRLYIDSDIYIKIKNRTSVGAVNKRQSLHSLLITIIYIMVKSLKKSFAGVMIAAFVFAGFATPAKAQTVAELQALVNQLMAKISAMSGGNSSSCTTFGLPGIMGVQQAVNQLGYMPALMADGANGPKTKAGVMWAQNKLGVSADGAWGMKTNAAYMAWLANCSGTPSNPGTGSTGDLNGDFGTINDVNELSQYNNEEVGEGEEDVIVLGFEIEASNDGDIEIDTVRVSFDPTGNGASDNLDDYASEVTVWFGDEKVGSADVEDFSQASDDTYSKTISLDNGVVVEGDETEKFYVAVSAANSFDSSDISGDSWTVDVESVRFVDGSGVVTTETGYDLDGMDVPVDFVSFSTSADTELKISTDSDSPDADVVVVDDSTSTDDVVLLKGKLKLEGTSDVVLDEMPISFSPVGANINVMAESLKLVIGGEEYSESVPSIADGATASLTFDNLDLDIEAGDTVEFTVMADMTDMDGTIFAEGDTLEANVTTSNRDLMDVENEEGDQLSDSSEKSGTANGEAQEFRTEGVMLTLVSTDADAGSADSDQTGTFTIKFKVKAIGSAVYVSSQAAASLTTTGVGAIAGVERAGTSTIGGTSVTVVNTTDADLTSGVGNYLIEEGEEETLEMVVTASLPTAGADGQFRALLRGLDWSTTDVYPLANTYTSNLDSFKTSYISLQ